MKTAGFTFVRNAIKYDYPVVEAIQSILPLCDEFVVAVGNSEDDTLTLIQEIDSPKIKIIQTVWDDNLRTGGAVLAQETNKAFRAISGDCTWAFYIQADEVIHEKYHNDIKKAMYDFKDSPEIDGLLFDYLHFYGSYDYVGESLRWYSKEIRIIRNRADIYSYKDAQGFRKGNNKKLRVKQINASVYHYGWVKPPRAMQQKQETFNKLWHSDDWVKENIAPAEEFDYSKIDALRHFEGTHPIVMQPRIAKKNWTFTYDVTRNTLKLKEKIKRFIRKLTGKQIGQYKNYILLK